MKPNNNGKVHIGTIGYIDHSKRTLKYAVEQTLKNKKENKEVEYPYNFNIEVVDYKEKPKVLKKYK